MKAKATFLFALAGLLVHMVATSGADNSLLGINLSDIHNGEDVIAAVKLRISLTLKLRLDLSQQMKNDLTDACNNALSRCDPNAPNLAALIEDLVEEALQSVKGCPESVVDAVLGAVKNLLRKLASLVDFLIIDKDEDDDCPSCPPQAFCGDGVKNGDEECDDGNTKENDGCSSTCKLEFCGDDIINNGDEECDDGNTISGDGCSSICELEPICGDGEQEGAEECDDGNTENNDGCSSTCKIEVCGDGIMNGNEQRPEECDDGNDEDNDECTNTCKVPLCGNNILDDTEDCDDGNHISGDGCSSSCRCEMTRDESFYPASPSQICPAFAGVNSRVYMYLIDTDSIIEITFCNNGDAADPNVLFYQGKDGEELFFPEGSPACDNSIPVDSAPLCERSSYRAHVKAGYFYFVFIPSSEGADDFRYKISGLGFCD